MEVKIKAKHLVEKFRTSVNEYGMLNVVDRFAAIQCAIIAVDEILEVVSSDESAIIVELQYYQQVRKELEAM